jgi:three-Cys-motif partner protein
VFDGSPLVAWRAVQNDQPFSEMHLGDMEPGFVDAACGRLKQLGAPSVGYSLPALDAARAVVQKVHRNGLHFALLDPFKLESLSFELIKTLASLKHIDMLLHVSAMDFTRNLDTYLGEGAPTLDIFAPGWRAVVEYGQQGQEASRVAILKHWSGLVESLGFSQPKYDLVTASRNQRLYWLAFISRETIANSFWEKIRYVSGQRDLLSGLT